MRAPAGTSRSDVSSRSSAQKLKSPMLSLLNRNGLAEQHGGVRADLEVAQVAGGEGVALLAGDVAVDQRLGGERREVAQVARVPQRELGDGAVLDVVTHLVGRAQTGQRDLALGVRGGQVASGRGDADRGGRDDALEVRVVGQQRGGRVEGLLVVVVAVDGVDELDVGVVGRQGRLHHLDPGVLVGGVGRGREDRDLTGVADLLGDHVDLDLGDALGGGLVDEQVATRRVGVGVEGDDLGAGVAGGVDGVAQGLWGRWPRSPAR